MTNWLRAVIKSMQQSLETTFHKSSSRVRLLSCARP